ncbi:MAG: SUMF1/EgtB/PvdO family nonheme iron enzyme [Bradymonadales bacterium]|nr:SUMF1/EgtB/PvdO family nonheme iron enzyme [Bradymonadales bacterium]
MPRIGSSVLGRYEILEVLGEGGFGVVYLANDRDAGGKVALKVLDPEKGSQQDFVERFRQEVRVIRSLSHHNTVKVFDVDQTEKGCHFMVMEHVEGEDLAQLAGREGKLPVARVVRIGRQILASLAEAHSRGIIHRDLKPQNIKVQQLQGDPDHVKVLDFGIAKVFGELATVKTRTGLPMCTPAYASPELLRAKEVDPSSDLYSLGLILLELATGMPAISGDSEADLIALQISREPISIPEALANEPLGSVIERALQKDRAQRYQRAEEMLRDLEEITGATSHQPTKLFTYEMPQVGDLVNERYRILEELGAGGFAKVYLVEDRKGFGRQAMKVIDLMRSAEDRMEDRFNQEVAVIRQLTHYNTVKIWDVGVTETGCLFFIMEYVDGEPLNRLIEREAPMPVERVVHIAVQILKSLSEAHEKGIVHRDLKPANVFVCQLKNEVDFVKVIDFGIARVFEPGLRMVETQRGMVLCTPNYAAPELLRQQGASPATDIYALGLMMVEMLTGSTPITGTTPSDIIIRQLDPGPNPLPPAIESAPIGAVIRKAIAKEQAQRYRDADQMLVDLRKLEKPGPNLPPPEPALRPDGKEAARKPEGSAPSGSDAIPGAGLPTLQGLPATLVRMDPEEDLSAAPTGSSSRHRNRLIYAIGALSLVAMVTAIALLAGRAGDGEENQIAEEHPADAGPVPSQERVASSDQGMSRDTASAETRASEQPRTVSPGQYVLIRAGSYTMGSPSSEPGREIEEALHQVNIARDFYLQASEVTQGQWRLLMGNNPSTFSSCGEDCPVEGVNWWEALAYCNELSWLEGLTECYTLHGCSGRAGEGMTCTSVDFAGLSCPGYRLPTEAEWEYAARAGTRTALYSGPLEIHGQNNAPALNPIAWYGGNSQVSYPDGFPCSDWPERQLPADTCGTHPVGQKRGNAWELYDMLGNVFEWTWDRFGEYSIGSPVTDPLGPGSGTRRVVRGGGWGLFASHVRSAYRGGEEPGTRYSDLGFRPARTADPDTAPATEERQSLDLRPERERPAEEHEVVPIEPPIIPPVPAQPVIPPTPPPEWFVLIRAGSFTMGSPESESGRRADENQHRVTISRDYYLQATEVTQEQWRALMGNNPSEQDYCFDSCPVENVKWWEALAYCNALSRSEDLEECYQLEGCRGRPGRGMTCSSATFSGLSCRGYRLPTEAEWEYAARAGTDTSRYCGSERRCLRSIAWYYNEDAYSTSPVGRKEPNNWGMYDMLGNVSEWTWDLYGPYPQTSVTDPLGAATGSERVNRGGNWGDEARNVRAARRNHDRPGAYYNMGFRPARTAGP